MTSHQVADIMKLADYLCVLHNGKQIGTFEKEKLLQRYRKYWMSSDLPEDAVPGEIARAYQSTISDHLNETEAFFSESHLFHRPPSGFGSERNSVIPAEAAIMEGEVV
ncbi:hypothetical protein [Lentibacillus halodurans]|nr:hypothetical protein [Lentibacillus halodurans]